MSFATKSTGEFYIVDYYQVIDVSARLLSPNLFSQPEGEELEMTINNHFQKARGDHFQLLKVTEKREKTFKLLSGSSDTWSETYRVDARGQQVLKTLKWTGKRFVEVAASEVMS